MQLIFKQRIFSFLDSYDIYSQTGEVVYKIKGELAVGHRFRVLDAYNNEVGYLRQRLLTFLPKFEIYKNGVLFGTLKKELSFLKPRYSIDYNGWTAEGNFFEWDYRILSPSGMLIATVSKQFLKLTDTYVIDVFDDDAALDVLLFVLAIDAEKCSRENG